MLKLSGSGVTQWAGAVAVLVATAGHAAAFSVPVHSPLCNPMAGATRPSLVRMTRAPSDELYALPLRCGFATALSSMLPLAVQAEEVTAFKASGAADALGSLEIGVLIVGLLVKHNLLTCVQRLILVHPCLVTCEVRIL
jgi:hypothetical protein